MSAGSAPRRRQEDVEKSGPRDLDALDLGHRREVLDDEVGDLSRRALRDARQDHRCIRRVVAVLGLARDFPRARVGLGQARLRERRPHAVGQPICEPHSRNRVPVRHTVVTKKKQPTMRARGPAREEDTRRRVARHEPDGAAAREASRDAIHGRARVVVKAPARANRRRCVSGRGRAERPPQTSRSRVHGHSARTVRPATTAQDSTPGLATPRRDAGDRGIERRRLLQGQERRAVRRRWARPRARAAPEIKPPKMPPDKHDSLDGRARLAPVRADDGVPGLGKAIAP